MLADTGPTRGIQRFRSHRGMCSKSYAKDGWPKTLANRRFTPFDFASVFSVRSLHGRKL